MTYDTFHLSNMNKLIVGNNAMLILNVYNTRLVIFNLSIFSLSSYLFLKSCFFKALFL